MSRDLIVIANWKMYKTAKQAVDYIEEVLPLVEGCQAKIFLAVPFTSISAAAKVAKGTAISVCAQNMNDQRDGAFTGEIAALMLIEAGAEAVILGHSERRSIFKEDDALINGKVIRALSDDLVPILCVGETLAEREGGQMEEVLRRQIELGLKDVSKEAIDRVILAYEPVWAIGTGKVATPKQAEEAHAFCRATLSDLFGKRKADGISILYGGSVKPANVAELVAEEDIDGVLVGGASLDPVSLGQIVMNCQKSAPVKKPRTKPKKETE